MDTDYYRQYEPFFGSWKIVRLIGEGTYGKVFEICRSEYGFEEKAALKIISIPASKSEYNSVLTDCMDERSATEYFRNYMQEMIREISLMSKLKGNSYIVCYEDHEVKNRAETVGWDIMIRMELLTPLNEYTREKGTLGKDEVIRLGIDICKALEICQKYDIIHRDIKPENIFVADYGNFKLGDFGIARIASQTSGASTRAGTNAYMAPEIYRGEHYGKTVDLYSLGLVLYRLLNDNRLPFMPQYPAPLRFQDRENAQAMRLSGASIPAPTHADPNLANVIAKACAYNAEDRFASATDMRLALESVLQPEKTAIGTVPVACESSQPSSNTTPNPYSEASNESVEATISRFADGKAATAQQEDADKTVSRFADTVAPESTVSLPRQKQQQSTTSTIDEKAEILQKTRKAGIRTKIKSSIAIILTGVVVTGYYFYSAYKSTVEAGLSSDEVHSTVDDEPSMRLAAVEINNESGNVHLNGTFGYPADADSEWNALQITGDSNPTNCKKVEREFNDAGAVERVTATFADGNTEVYDVAIIENDLSKEMHITWENTDAPNEVIYSIEQSSNGRLSSAGVSCSINGEVIRQGNCNVAYDEANNINQLYYTWIFPNPEFNSQVTYEFKQPDENNPYAYNATGPDGDTETFSYYPNINQSAWGKWVTTNCYNGNQYESTLLYLGDKTNALAFSQFWGFVPDYTIGMDYFLFEAADPFGIELFLNVKSYVLSGELTNISLDDFSNPLELTSEDAYNQTAQKVEVKWTYEPIGTTVP